MIWRPTCLRYTKSKKYGILSTVSIKVYVLAGFISLLPKKMDLYEILNSWKIPILDLVGGTKISDIIEIHFAQIEHIYVCWS